MSTLKKEAKETALKDLLISTLNNLPNVQNKRFDVYTLLLICETTEKFVGITNKYKIDKKQIIINAYSQIFNLQDNEKTIISNNIEFIINNELVKDITYLFIIYDFLKSLIKKKK